MEEQGGQGLERGGVCPSPFIGGGWVLGEQKRAVRRERLPVCGLGLKRPLRPWAQALCHSDSVFSSISSISLNL